MNAFHYAVVVGIKGYPGISDLQSALKDAQAFSNWLTTAGEVPAANVERVSIDQSFNSLFDAKPTRTEVNNALRKVNAAVSAAIKNNPLDWNKTRLYFYVSGHGIAPDGAEAALLMANAGPDAWGENVPCGAYMRRYEKCQYFREVVVFADCCRLSKAAEFPGPPFNNNASIGTVNAFLGFATQLGDAAYEPTNGNGDEARSYFTQALLEGLGGAASDVVTGEITTTTLAKYTTERVKALTLDKRYPQIPRMTVDLTSPIVFRAATAGTPKSKRLVKLRLPTTFNGDAELVGDSFQKIAEHNSLGGDWHEQLDDGFYEVRPKGAVDGSVFRQNGLFRVLGEGCDVDL